MHGWTNALFSSEGADAGHDGRPLTPAATLTVDANTATVSFTLPAAALGKRRDLSGARVYLNTWDYDGGYRALAPQPGGAVFGGGEGSRDPLWLDATSVLRLP